MRSRNFLLCNQLQKISFDGSLRVNSVFYSITRCTIIAKYQVFFIAVSRKSTKITNFSFPSHAKRFIYYLIVISQVRPGLVSKDADGKLTCRPIFSRIVSLFAEQNELQYAVPGGLIGVGTKIEPTLCRADRLVGQVCFVRV